MTKTELELKERIKELTCLYEVSSIILKTDSTNITNSLERIAKCTQKAFQFPDKVVVSIYCPYFNYHTTNEVNSKASIETKLQLFQEFVGKIVVSFTSSLEANFLKEEQELLDNIGLKVTNLFEKIEIKKNESNLKRQMERADRLVILGELTAGIAHELNTPLTNILGFAELLQEQLQLRNKENEDLNKIIKNAAFSREVVKKLMFFACEMPKELKIINLVPIIQDALNLLESTFRKSKVKYVFKTSGDEILLKADPIQLTQIIFNLIINAIYFSRENDTVTIDAKDSAKEITLEISDEGKGLNEEEIENIFNPFYTTKPVGEGTGLGLSVVHGIVKGHKGRISVENNKIAGAKFTIVLPK